MRRSEPTSDSKYKLSYHIKLKTSAETISWNQSQLICPYHVSASLVTVQEYLYVHMEPVGVTVHCQMLEEKHWPAATYGMSFRLEQHVLSGVSSPV